MWSTIFCRKGAIQVEGKWTSGFSRTKKNMKHVKSKKKKRKIVN